MSSVSIDSLSDARQTRESGAIWKVKMRFVKNNCRRVSMFGTRCGRALSAASIECLERRTLLSGTSTVYVDVNSPGPTHDGSSWSDAYVSLATALNAASGTEQILVAQGTYTPGAVATATFQLKNNVSIIGGYAGAINPSAAPNTALYPTTLSGVLVNSQHSDSIVTGSGTNSTAVLS